MVPQAQIVGVYPVLDSPDPVHLIEMVVQGDPALFDFGLVIQRIAGHPQSEWQVAYDERIMESTPGEWTRVVFFFHFLDLAEPLETPAGVLELPAPTNRPSELAALKYEAP